MIKIIEKNGFKWLVDEDYPASKEPIRDYESHVIGFCVMISDMGKVFVDVGACVGKYTIPMSKNYHKVVAIEPNPKNLEFLKKNVEINNCDNVEIHEVAVSDKEGKTKLLLSGAQSKIGVESRKNTITVDTKTLDNLIGKADVIKIDVEGAELQVVMGAKRLIKECKPVFVIEHNEYWGGEKPKDHITIMKFLISHSYYPFNYNYTHWIYVPKEWVAEEKRNFAGEMSDAVLGRMFSHHVFYEVVLRNIKSGRPWYYGLPYNWWYGMSLLEFVDFLTNHVLHEEEWLKIHRETLINNYNVKI